jgi:hypothetical protein
MVRNIKKHTRKMPAEQGADPVIPKAMKIGAATPYDLVTFCYTSLSL